MAASSSSSASSSRAYGEYDVFLSFRGEDTRRTFVAHLYGALDRAGFRTFKDDEKFQRGKCISKELFYYINHSKIAVIVFSKNYANSSWCLDELVEIMECMRSKGQIVLPVFYHVKPSHVRKQKRNFFEAFRYNMSIWISNYIYVYIMFKWICNHSQAMERVEKRRLALTEAANISGLDLEDSANGDEEKFIQQIVQLISEKLQPRPFRVAEYPVGITERADKIITLLEEDEALFVGICGIGGAGKTTVAKAVFNRVHKQFERFCFLENVREKSSMSGGLAELQSHLLRDILMDQTIKIVYPDRGINEIKDRLGNKRLLLLLDDVDDENILKYLVGVGHEWFCSGSKIIITTRNKRLLEKHSMKTYDIPLLNKSEATQLFSRHAFKQMKPEDGYVELLDRAKDYAKGLPLALQVLGSALGARSKQEWLALLFRWKENPPNEIDDVLRISFDGLDKEEKELFLDIACFFNGYQKEDVMNVHKREELDPVIGLKILCERCLISMSDHNTLTVHELLQEMGRKIVHQESEDPGKRSRLWSYPDIYEVFNNNMVTENIQAIMLPKKRSSSLEGLDFFGKGLQVKAEAFKKMRKLRILQINGVQLDGCLTHLPNELRYLEWNGYPGEYLPQSFHPKKLVQLHLSNSLIKGIENNSKFVMTLKDLDLRYCKNLVGKHTFTGFPCLEKLYLEGCKSLVEVHFEDMKLKILDLRRCENLKQTPNLSGLQCLEELYLGGCTSVVEVHPSIEFHERLVRLDLGHCKNLKFFATRINVISLERLHLRGCSKLEKFPDLEGDDKCLKTLFLNGTAIKELSPSVVKYLKGLHILNLTNCKMLERLPTNIGKMKSLDLLHLRGTAIEDLPPSISLLKKLRELHLERSGIKKLPSSIAQLTDLAKLYWSYCNLDEEDIQNLPHQLELLDLGGNNFVSLPESFTHLTNLRYLTLDDCLSLQTMDSLPSSVSHLSAQGCKSLERYSILSNRFKRWNFSGSHKLAENQGNNKPNIYYSQSQLPRNSRIVLPGSEIPSWFSHISDDGQIDEDMTNWVCLRMDDPSTFDYLEEICICAVFEIEDDDEKPLKLEYFELTLQISGGSCIGFFQLLNQIEIYNTDHILFMRSTCNRSGGVYGKCNSDGCCIKASIQGSRNDRTPLKMKVKKWGFHPIMAGHKQRESIPPNTQPYMQRWPGRPQSLQEEGSSCH